MSVSIGDVLFVAAFGVAALGLGVAINNADFSVREWSFAIFASLGFLVFAYLYGKDVV